VLSVGDNCLWLVEYEGLAIFETQLQLLPLCGSVENAVMLEFRFLEITKFISKDIFTIYLNAYLYCNVRGVLSNI
jgi:hypothetical protein